MNPSHRLRWLEKHEDMGFTYSSLCNDTLSRDAHIFETCARTMALKVGISKWKDSHPGNGTLDITEVAADQEGRLQRDLKDFEILSNCAAESHGTTWPCIRWKYFF